jgi:16S rRNA (adenine1518-N6/adenine1519-N6)-dimethyltransferase
MKQNSELGQHFLINQEVLKKEIESANICREDNVIEIGAGTGNLTKELTRISYNVLAFEIDKKFRTELDKLESSHKNLKIVYGNALKYDWKGYTKIVSNIPYNISEQLILKSIEPQNSNIKELILIVGENFKEILEKKETKIGILADLYFDFQPIMKVNKKDFEPQPKINSWLIRLTRKNPHNSTSSEDLVKNIISKSGKIKNAIIYSLVEQGKTKNQAREIIEKMNLNQGVLEKNMASITGDFIKKLLEEL